MTKEKNIYQRLLEVKKACHYLQKDAKGYNYTYVSPEQAYSALNPILIEQGLFIIKDVENVETIERVYQKEKTEWISNKKAVKIVDVYELLYKVSMKFTIINVDNPEQKVSIKWAGTGENGTDKGYGSALTYGLRYFLLSQFDIATGKDDPDARQEKTQVNQVKEPKKLPSNETALQLINKVENEEDFKKLQAWLNKYPNFAKVKDIKEKFNIVKIKYSQEKK